MPDPNDQDQGELQIAAAEITPEAAAEAALVAGYRPADRRGFQQFLAEVRQGLRKAYLANDVRTWGTYCQLPKDEFARLFSAATNLALLGCSHCGNIVNQLHQAHSYPGGAAHERCDDCLGRYYNECANCRHFYRRSQSTRPEQGHWRDIFGFGKVCGPCFNLKHNEHAIFECRSCMRWYANDHVGQRIGYCQECAPPDRSKCQSRGALAFEFPALNIEAKVVASEAIVAVSTGGGDISTQGMRAIKESIYNRTGGKLGSHGVYLLELDPGGGFDPSWQNKEGNFPKRLAKLLLQTRAMKLNEEFMVEIGNLAKAHTTNPATHHIAFTRDINRPANEFINNGSCWWGGSWHSRCDFKWHGGIAVRTFSDPAKGNPKPLTRAWMLPMKLSGTANIPKLGPDIELPADAYFLFNPYGMDLIPYARLIAAMTGKSYKKVMAKGTLYINNNMGALIAEQSICDKIETINHGRLAEDNCGCGAGGRLG